jgi:hypothetical protein
VEKNFEWKRIAYKDKEEGNLPLMDAIISNCQTSGYPSAMPMPVLLSVIPGWVYVCSGLFCLEWYH